MRATRSKYQRMKGTPCTYKLTVWHDLNLVTMLEYRSLAHIAHHFGSSWNCACPRRFDKVILENPENFWKVKRMAARSCKACREAMNTKPYHIWSSWPSFRQDQERPHFRRTATLRLEHHRRPPPQIRQLRADSPSCVSSHFIEPAT